MTTRSINYINQIFPTSGADVTVADHDEFLGSQSFQAYRSPRMEFVGADPHLGAESILETVGKTGRGIHHHGTGIHLGEEAPRPAEILGDDGIGMLRSIPGDMIHGGLESRADPERER